MPVLHPGELIKRLVIEPSGVSQSELSRRLGFNQPQPVNELVNGKRGFTPKMALLFEQVTGGAFPAVFWLVAQALYDAEAGREVLAPGRRSIVDPVTLPATEEIAREADCEEFLQLAHQLEGLATRVRPSAS